MKPLREWSTGRWVALCAAVLLLLAGALTVLEKAVGNGSPTPPAAEPALLTTDVAVVDGDTVEIEFGGNRLRFGLGNPDRAADFATWVTNGLRGALAVDPPITTRFLDRGRAEEVVRRVVEDCLAEDGPRS